MNHSSDKIKWGAWGANNQSKNNTITKQSITYEYKHCNVTPQFLNFKSQYRITEMPALCPNEPRRTAVVSEKVNVIYVQQ